jgi:hypothetical protein
MKLRNFLFIAVAILVGFSSCSKDDDELIIGTWKYDTMKFEIETTDPTMTAFMKIMLEVMASQMDMTLTFKDNGTYTSTTSMAGMGSETETGTYKFEKGKLIMDGEAINYELSKKRLTLKQSGSDGLFDIFDEMDGIGVTKLNVSISFDKK